MLGEDVQESLVDLVRSNIFYLVLIGLAIASLVSYVSTGVLAAFYFVVIGVLLVDELTLKIVIRILRRQFPSFFKSNAFWRVGLPTQVTSLVLSIFLMGLLGFKEQFGLTLQNMNDGLWLVLLVGLPFAALYSFGAFVFLRKGQAGTISTLDSLKNPSDRIGTVVYAFTMPGIGEEILYRGLIQGYLSINMTGFILFGSFPLLYSTIVASIIFILVHLYTMGESLTEALIQLPGRTIITLILAITFQLTGSLIAPIIIHNLFDGFLVIAGVQATRNRNSNHAKTS